MHNVKKPGFTIIEVVLVLAIAGLIFLMIFVALPNLQSSQRDTQRRNDLVIIAAAIDQYRTNNRGNPPPSSTGRRTSSGTTTYLDATTPDAFRPYLSGLEESAFTDEDRVIVLNYVQQSGDSISLRWGTGGTPESWHSRVDVMIGTLCPDEPFEHNNDTHILPATHRKSDYAIVRSLENGDLVCRDSRGGT